jgi:hypothetical protein
MTSKDEEEKLLEPFVEDLDDEEFDDDDEEPGEGKKSSEDDEIRIPICTSHSKRHRWVNIAVSGAPFGIEFCHNCRIYNPLALKDDVDLLMKQQGEILEATQQELYATQKKLNNALGEVSGYKSDLKHKQAELDRACEQIIADREKAGEITRLNTLAIAATNREDLIDQELTRVLGVMTKVLPFMDRTTYPEVDSAALYVSMAQEFHSLHTLLRKLYPSHEGWMQYNAFGLCRLILQTGAHDRDRIARIRHLVIDDKSARTASAEDIVSAIRPIVR